MGTALRTVIIRYHNSLEAAGNSGSERQNRYLVIPRASGCSLVTTREIEREDRLDQSHCISYVVALC